MRNTVKSCISGILALTLLLTAAIVAHGSDDVDISGIIADTAEYIRATITSPMEGQVGGDWAVIGLMRSGAAVPDKYIRGYYDRVAGRLEGVDGVLSPGKNSEYSRVVIAMAAIGADPRDAGGYDLLEPLMDYDTTLLQGVNGPIFALIALSCAGLGDEPVARRYIEAIVSRQLPDGGYAISGTISDPDTTAMAVTALARHRSQVDVTASIDRAVERLSKLQRESGGYTSYSSTNSESVSQAIIALCSLGIPISDSRFIKNGNSLLDNLLTYYIQGRGFEHEAGYGTNMMATEQALCALAALRRARNGANALYDMSDAPDLPPETPKDGLDGKHPDISVPDAVLPDVTFSDAGGHVSEPEIIALSKRGIINGYPGGVFMPDGKITRAEFAAVIVRALGLLRNGDKTVTFKDVPATSWFCDYAYSAYGYGIILGKGAEIFDPEGLIDRQEAAVMVFRAAALCGLTQPLDETAVRNILSQFTDYRTVASWAAEELAFCYYTGILGDEAIEIKPTQKILRCEAAEMVYMMLRNTQLI